MVERNVGQMSLADGLVQARRSSILDEVEAVVDWGPLRSLLGKRGGTGAGNSSYPAEVLRRCLLAGIWHNLSDPALEAAIADRLSFRRFVGLSLHDQTPDHTTLWRFRQELAKDGLFEKIFAEINRQLEDRKLILKDRTLLDAALIPARAICDLNQGPGCAFSRVRAPGPQYLPHSVQRRCRKAAHLAPAHDDKASRCTGTRQRPADRPVAGAGVRAGDWRIHRRQRRVAAQYPRCNG